MIDLVSSWEAIRTIYFPRWDRKCKWRIRQVLPGAIGRGNGECSRMECLIRMSEVSSDPDELDSLIIHEICHAVSNKDDHGNEWQAKMRVAALRAQTLGRQRLTGKLVEDIAQAEKDMQIIFG